MDQQSEQSEHPQVEGRRGSPIVPPSSGLARSIRALFDGPSPARAARKVPLEERSAKSPVRDRFVTRIASFLRAAPDSRGRFVDGILEDARILRKEGGFYLVLDAVAALLTGEGEGTRADGLVLAGEMMDPLLAHYLALRVGMEKESGAREKLVAIAYSFPALSAPAFVEVLAESTDPESSRNLRGVLLHLGEDGRSAALTLLREPRWFAVRDGVRLVGESRDPDSVQALTVMLAHEDPGVRKETVIALTKVGGEDAGILVVGMLDDPDPGVREVAAMGVGEMRVLRAMRPLLELVATEDGEPVLVQVLLALGAMGDPGAVPAIEKKAVGSLFSRPPRPIRVAAYRALAMIGSPHARSLVEAAVEDKDIGVRQAVVEILEGNTGEEVERPT